MAAIIHPEKLLSTTIIPSNTLKLSTLTLPYHLCTLWLFTKNDFVTFCIPTTLFALLSALSGPILTTNPSPSPFSLLSRIPLALLVVWSNLLVFDIANQRHPTAVEEDCINKPHRPLPSGRITVEQTKWLLFWLAPVVLGLNWGLGCEQETLLLFTMTWMYNDLGGSDASPLIRNLLIALGYGLYSAAASRVAVESGFQLSGKGYAWIAVVTGVMLVTQHICDLKDVEGDRVRGRKSIPVVLGDEMARWSVAGPIVVCSVLCPGFFGLGLLSYLSTAMIGGVVAFRTLRYRDLKSDKTTWKLWAFWTCWLFALPLAKNSNCLDRENYLLQRAER
ncbi:hypothetical protein GQ43DRAFT_448595 [Delitschia confertaspora ATCC 74209]|uniref:Uncharacterized protein n=1 Tax=Delitschia confertaspora ATCC 74209 TaxID=1513339 RepID=A0A9P4JLZ1_9PLEO|nr:hypothetical protein GQ43DRAFT_448595 [Delitschia confertaspora ATCC 74209]